MVQVTVYAGAIMVLFLFVIMLLGAEQAGSGPDAALAAPGGCGAGGAALVVLMAYALLAGGRGPAAGGRSLLEGFGSPQAVGELLFSDYLLPFEVISILLLAAMVGAIVLTRDEARRTAADERSRLSYVRVALLG